MRLVRAALAMIVVLALTGCVPTREIPTAGPTDEEYVLWIDSQVDFYWDSLGFDDSLRPPSPDYVYVTSEEWPAMVVRCMNALGYENYTSTDDVVLAGEGPSSQQEQIDFYDCQTIYQVDPRAYGFFGGEVLEYLYDYNRTVLVPCLESHGVDVEVIPPRDEAAVVGGPYQGWNPYYWMYDRFDPTTSAYDRFVFESCPAYPAGEAFDRVRAIW